jgi:hypothetical protein
MNQKRLKINLARVFALFFALVLGAGCATQNRPGPEVGSKTAKDANGGNCQLLEHASAFRMMDAEIDKISSEQLLIESLQLRYPTNFEMIAHLNTVSKNLQTASDHTMADLRAMNDDWKKIGGDLYYYKLETGKEVERGVAAVSKGRVLNKYLVTKEPAPAAH